MAQGTASSQELLDAAYKHLGYDEGDLLDATCSPCGIDADDWLNKGEWLALAKSVGAEKVFFVQNNPVIIFASSETDNQMELFQQIWNMARPPLLFLASPGLLAVYSLNQGPARNQQEWDSTLETRQLDTANRIAEVSYKLQPFSREQIETGRLFEDERFGDDKRADKTLIADLRIVRNRLLDTGLHAEYAHSLIGRSIFIRYLEDRGILTNDYFKKVTRGKPKWRRILDTPPEGVFVEPELKECRYFRVLCDKNFTYALFEQLAKDFNGDMFPSIKEEREDVAQDHLDSLRGFLFGNADGAFLFFFAYKFDIIPIELISSIYEEFYNTDKEKTENNGSHYTPAALVEFLLNQVLTPECLAKNPRIMDPACGSGIFLVEAFRRIVRYRLCSRNGHRLSDVQLRRILRKQISGIDINGEAVRVAAFSLYLAFLHYQRPPDILEQIRKGKILPNLKYDKTRKKRKPKQHYDILLEANSFDIEVSISPSHKDVLARFVESCAEIVVGNPPWGSPGNKKEEKESRDAMDVAVQWCERQEPRSSIGDREWSQAFIHRVIDLLCDGGRAALLVSSGVLFKIQENSRNFREEWLTTTILHSIVNFVHVRDVFFKGKARSSGAQSPFLAVCFTKQKPGHDSCFEYWSAIKTSIVKETQSVVLSAADIKRLRQDDVVRKEHLWKTYWWGSHRDESLICNLGMESTLENLFIRNNALVPDDIGRGFEEKSGNRPRTKHLDHRMLPVACFNRYGPLGALEETPSPLYLEGNTKLYKGLRLIIKRGVSQRGREKGRIIARLERKTFCFRHSLYGVKLPNSATWEGEILLGIFWSSLTRYYYWLTTGSWGMWHHEILQERIQEFPIRLPDDLNLRSRITNTVQLLHEKGANQLDQDVLGDDRGNSLSSDETAKLERKLDEAVFDLYELNEGERDLIRDMCEYGLDLFYDNINSVAVKPVETDRPAERCGVLEDIPSRRNRQKGLEGYILTFLRIWNRELEPDGEFNWQVIQPGRNIPMIALVFSTQYKKESILSTRSDDTAGWKSVLKKLEDTLLMPISKRVYIDGIVRAVSDTEIMIIKRNERRLWTRSMAREDAEATLLQAMNRQDPKGGS